MNRSVMITGSTRGIGLSTAAEFLKKGDRVAIFCRHPGHVNKARRHLLAFGRPENILGLVGDVRLLAPRSGRGGHVFSLLRFEIWCDRPDPSHGR